jgi:DNA-binding CsgD family transcriptional regulator
MRVLLVGSPADRTALRAQLSAASITVVAEFPTLVAAQAWQARSGSPDEHSIDAIVIASESTFRAHPVDEDDDSEEMQEPLTPREVQVVELLAEGLSNKTIAARLGISDQTVKFHVASISGKLGAVNRTDAVRRAVRRGLITL